jgi:hypothetical protein
MANAPSLDKESKRSIAEENAPAHAPHPPVSVASQVALTIKLLVGAALGIGLFWIIDGAL